MGGDAMLQILTVYSIYHDVHGFDEDIQKRSVFSSGFMD